MCEKVDIYFSVMTVVSCIPEYAAQNIDKLFKHPAVLCICESPISVKKIKKFNILQFSFVIHLLSRGTTTNEICYHR